MKKCPSVSDLTNIIDTVKLAVDESCFGPVFVYPHKGDITQKQVNQLCWALIMILIPQIIHKTEFEGSTQKKGGNGNDKNDI